MEMRVQKVTLKDLYQLYTNKLYISLDTTNGREVVHGRLFENVYNDFPRSFTGKPTIYIDLTFRIV